MTEILLIAGAVLLLVLGWRLFLRDPQRRLAEQERRHLQYARHYLDTTHAVMVELDREGRITMINRAGCELLGYSREELLGRDWFAVCLPQQDSSELIVSGGNPGPK